MVAKVWCFYIILLQKLFSLIWHEKVLPSRQWGEGLFVKGDREQPGNYRGITLCTG